MQTPRPEKSRIPTRVWNRTFGHGVTQHFSRCGDHRLQALNSPTCSLSSCHIHSLSILLNSQVCLILSLLRFTKTGFRSRGGRCYSSHRRCQGSRCCAHPSNDAFLSLLIFPVKQHRWPPQTLSLSTVALESLTTTENTKSLIQETRYVSKKLIMTMQKDNGLLRWI